jgi:AAA+ superfamily predicted ATPase
VDLPIPYLSNSPEIPLRLLRRLQEYVALLVDFVWRHHQEHTHLWKNHCFTNAKYFSLFSREQVQEFTARAEQLVFIREILEKKEQEIIQKEAIQKSSTITTENQSHLQDSQKIIETNMANMITRKLNCNVKRLSEPY